MLADAIGCFVFFYLFPVIVVLYVSYIFPLETSQNLPKNSPEHPPYIAVWKAPCVYIYIYIYIFYTYTHTSYNMYMYIA